MNANITDQIQADLTDHAEGTKLHHTKTKRLAKLGLIEADGTLTVTGQQVLRETLDADQAEADAQTEIEDMAADELADAKPVKAKRTRKPADLNACHCGCGATTRSLFAQGHDARYAGIVGRRVAETAPITADTPWLDAEVSRHMVGCSDALIRKAIRVAVNHRTKLAKRAS
ncbi:hypothetical protein [Mycolicibacterium fallax]|uniref:Uncharacterized protein n=1 Tax=Mycolicibacterium fallax TaxID=1793 RepID=A0A1X1RFI6_MYCFA|nr:hypothetical protein [Mycolicibacterium fallax]ORV04598.1 hypothetical protein AWC04_08370 [Mycolicibacterium fallax]BBY99658.1 hypothetical protein MFAL_31250 [Mycolicibacterium fallax]